MTDGEKNVPIRDLRVYEVLDFSTGSESTDESEKSSSDSSYYDRVFASLEGSSLFTNVLDYFGDDSTSSSGGITPWSPPRVLNKKRARWDDTSDDDTRPRKKRCP